MQKVLIIASLSAVLAGLTGCDTIATKTNMLSDEKILSVTSGALGRQPSELSIESRRTDGTNTYVNLMATDKKEYTCIINGGNLLSMGMTNPPTCAKKGDPINATPFK